MQRHLTLAAIVLAAGAGRRFGDDPGGKLRAPLDGRPVLAHVLDALRSVQLEVTVVVLGHGAAAIEEAIDWGPELRVRNHAPDDGLSRSLKVGIDALRALPQAFDGAFIVLGDQPRLHAEALTDLARAAAAARPADRAVVVPRYAGAGVRNPVLLLRPAWTWVDELDGDVGLASMIDDRPDQVLEVPVAGEMPDIDTPEDLARLDARSATR